MSQVHNQCLVAIISSRYGEVVVFVSVSFPIHFQSLPEVKKQKTTTIKNGDSDQFLFFLHQNNQ